MIRARRDHAAARRLMLACALASVLAVAQVASAGPARATPADGPELAAQQAGDNGRLPSTALVEVAGVRLAHDAAAAMAALIAHARRDGANIALTDGYRTYEQQVEVKARKPRLAATPGSSMHGWGLAVDVDLRVTDLGWLHEHAATYGWVNPPWAQPHGSKPEPWHWEFVGAPPVVAAAPDPLPVLEPGALVATMRLEPSGVASLPWFEVREGFGDLGSTAAHYPGTAMPGGRGNVAVAGHHRRPGAPLRAVERLVAGDTVRVRLPSGGEHRYVVSERVVLGPSDGWAVGPDPLGTGVSSMLTLTTSIDGGQLLVVWAHRAPDAEAGGRRGPLLGDLPS
jgi:hypothetical protein